MVSLCPHTPDNLGAHGQEGMMICRVTVGRGREAWCLVLLLPFINYMTLGICLSFLSTVIKHLLKRFVKSFIIFK